MNMTTKKFVNKYNPSEWRLRDFLLSYKDMASAEEALRSGKPNNHYAAEWLCSITQTMGKGYGCGVAFVMHVRDKVHDIRTWPLFAGQGSYEGNDDYHEAMKNLEHVNIWSSNLLAFSMCLLKLKEGRLMEAGREAATVALFFPGGEDGETLWQAELVWQREELFRRTGWIFTKKEKKPCIG